MMTKPQSEHLSLLYPDIDPSRPVPPTYVERFSLTLAAAVLAFGAAAGDLIVMAAGLVLVLFAAIAPALKTQRRVRNEARARFPDAGWAEDTPPLIPLAISYPITWLFIIAVVGAALWFVPEKFTLWGAAAAAMVTALLVWFMPGLSPIWTPKKQPVKTPATEADTVEFPAGQERFEAAVPSKGTPMD
ncbi:MAG: hemin receptor [Corynebacterium sp.]|nr:hemin receptor [Corynebacterium sp.]